MIKITAKFLVDKDLEKEFLALVQELEEKSNSEKGCISYKLFRDLNNDNVFTVFEEWEDEKAIALHNDSEHFKRLIPQLHDIAKGIEINLHEEVKYE